MNGKKKAELRLKKILLDDKLKLPNGFSALLTSDLKRIANSYFEYAEKDFYLNVGVDQKGRYEIVLKLTADRVLPLKILALPDRKDA